MKKTKKFKTVGMVAKPHPPASRALVHRMASFLKARGLDYFCDPVTAGILGEKSRSKRMPSLASSVDLMLVLGGDGTLLALARDMPRDPIPILGINLGSLGFLTETTLEEAEAVLDEVLQGRYKTEERMMLRVEVRRGGKRISSQHLLNDVVINKSALARIVDLKVLIDGQLVATYHADGLILSTPTGSTAYSLSAGGPIVLPSLHAFCITPICPHTLTNRPLVVPDSVSIEVILLSGDEDVYCTMDGQVGFPLKVGDKLMVRRSRIPLLLLFPQHRNYFNVLREKLQWGRRQRLPMEQKEKA